jgi:hypothetical protein
MELSIPPLPQYVSMVWCLVMHRVIFTFTWMRELAYAAETLVKINCP